MVERALAEHRVEALRGKRQGVRPAPHPGRVGTRCLGAVEPLRRIRKLYPGKVRIIFKHHPWKFHRWARLAAIGSECAGRQGLFWKYHDLLFTEQRRCRPAIPDSVPQGCFR